MEAAVQREPPRQQKAAVLMGIWRGAQTNGNPAFPPASRQRGRLATRAIYVAQPEDRRSNGPIPVDRRDRIGKKNGKVEQRSSTKVPSRRWRDATKGVAKDGKSAFQRPLHVR